eukprot:4769132-Prymnesium_polylepis.1
MPRSLLNTKNQSIRLELSSSKYDNPSLARCVLSFAASSSLLLARVWAMHASCRCCAARSTDRWQRAATGELGSGTRG